MITIDELKLYGWNTMKKDTSTWYYDGWEYQYHIKSNELHYLNDGAEETYIAKIKDMGELKETYYLLENKEMIQIEIN